MTDQEDIGITARRAIAKGFYSYQEENDSIPWNTLAWDEAGYKIGAFEAAEFVIADLQEAGIEFHRGATKEVAESIGAVALLAGGLGEMMGGALVMALAERMSAYEAARDKLAAAFKIGQPAWSGGEAALAATEEWRSETTVLEAEGSAIRTVAGILGIDVTELNRAAEMVAKGGGK